MADATSASFSGCFETEITSIFISSSTLNFFSSRTEDKSSSWPLAQYGMNISVIKKKQKSIRTLYPVCFIQRVFIEIQIMISNSFSYEQVIENLIFCYSLILTFRLNSINDHPV